jgi:hypothetical protein
MQVLDVMMFHDVSIEKIETQTFACNSTLRPYSKLTYSKLGTRQKETIIIFYSTTDEC